MGLIRYFFGVKDDALIQAVYQERWDTIRVLLNRTDALRLIRYKEPSGKSALHETACERDPPLDIVQQLINLDSSQIAWQSKHGMTPLHYACSGDARTSDEVVMLMLSLAPHTAAISDNCGYLPLHWAIDYDSERLASIVRRLLTVHPTAVYAEALGRNPLSRFIDRWGQLRKQSNPIETFVLLLKAHVHGTVDEKATLSQEWHPIHEALKIKNITMPSKLLRVLVDTMHSECVQIDEGRNFPLHLLCARVPLFDSDSNSDDSDSYSKFRDNDEIESNY